LIFSSISKNQNILLAFSKLKFMEYFILTTVFH